MTPDGEFIFLDTIIPTPWTIDTLADINNAGNVCGTVKRPATPADGTTASTIYRPFRITEFTFILPIFP